jgi:hypothetical protein
MQGVNGFGGKNVDKNGEKPAGEDGFPAYVKNRAPKTCFHAIINDRKNPG